MAWTLTLALLTPMLGSSLVLAEDGAQAGLCPHHPEHTADCGYRAPDPGAPCGHTHDGSCGYVPASQGAPCGHVHDGSCGFVAAAEEIPCDLDCANLAADVEAGDAKPEAVNSSGAGTEGRTFSGDGILHREGCAYTPAAEGAPCGHVHDGSCGYVPADEGRPCTHEHDGSCGYIPADGGAPCAFACGLCVTGWTWDGGEDALVPVDGGWGLGLPGAGAENPVTAERLGDLLPRSVTVRTAAGSRSVPLIWDYAPLGEGVWEGSYSLSAELERTAEGDAYVLTEGVPAPKVLLSLGGGEPYAEPTKKYLNDWKFIDRSGNWLETPSLTVVRENIGQMSQEEIAQWLRDSVLPTKIRGWSAPDTGGTYKQLTLDTVNPGETMYVTNATGREIFSNSAYKWGFVEIEWNQLPSEWRAGETYTLVAATKLVTNGDTYQICVNSNDPEDYKDADGNPSDAAKDSLTKPEVLSLKVTLREPQSGYPGPVASKPVAKDENGNVTHKFVSNWEYVVPGGGIEIQCENNHFYSTALAIPLGDTTNLVKAITDSLPQRISGTGSNAGNVLVNAGFIPKSNSSGSGSTIEGYVDLIWNVKEVVDAAEEIVEGTTLTFYAQPKSNPGFLLRVNTNCKSYLDSDNGEADTAEAADILNLTVTLHDVDLALQDHIVTAAKPENVKVNLFDYWVEGYGESPSANKTQNPNGGDILLKSDNHAHEDNEGNPINDPAFYSAAQDWYKGINDGHLLLFGDGLIHAGLLNKGAGENTRYGKKYAGMEGIVKNVLDPSGYPELNLGGAKMILNGVSDSGDPGYRDHTLIKDYLLAGDHNESYGTDYRSDNIQNLSGTVIQKWTEATGKTLENTESLRYLFDPDVGNPFKKSYEDVTGLFQLDNDGYYYYKMRENFAEFNGAEGENGGRNHFTLYDAPATVRTDGSQSIGNFLPFNRGSEVFNGVDSDGNLTSSVPCSNNTMNHHLGMTVEVGFRQPAGGMINTGSRAQPMTFQFSGDDDVWVFVDDVLVLDMGGIHSEVYGIIDFASGDVLIGRGFTDDVQGIPEYDPKDPGATKNLVTWTNLRTLYEDAKAVGSTQWNNNTFASNTSHTLKMFYLERGNYDSSLAMRFNLQPVLYQQIKKVDQNGDPVKNVEFELYEAVDAVEGQEGAIRCLYTDSTIHDNREFFVRQRPGMGKLLSITTGEDGSAQFLDGEDGSYFNFADRGDQYYILREITAPSGYRKQPLDIVLHYDRNTAMLSVANRWTTGAYACSTVHVTGQPKAAHSPEEAGLVVAVPLMQRKSDKSWLALYGSNLAGFRSVPLTSEADILLAALHQAETGAADWRLSWDGGNRRLTGTLSDLPGLASRYTLIDPEHGDMQMAYVLITAEALGSLGIEGETPEARYQALRNYLESHTPEAACAAVQNGSRRLETDTFNRDFRSLIYIPNERRELHVLKIDQDGKPLSGAEFWLYSDAACTEKAASGVTDGNGMLVFSPTGADGTPGQAQMVWADSANTQYYLREKQAPDGYEINNTVIPVVVGIYGIYADAGSGPENGVSVVADVGRLTQTMRQYAMDGNVDTTLQDITAFMQTQESGHFSPDGWQDAKLAGSDVLRSMNLHFNKNHFVDYGLHDEDGGKGYYPFFVTDTGYIRARV